MIRKRSAWAKALAAVFSIFLILSAAPPAAHSSFTAGQWYGTWMAEYPVGLWASPEFPTGSLFEMFIYQDGADNYWAALYIPELGMFDASVPVEIVDNTIAIGSPQFAWGTIDGGSISGAAYVPDPYNPSSFLYIEWQCQRSEDVVPGPLPGAQCEELPPLYCIGGAADCSELVHFSPAIGWGYLDYLIYDETWQDQYRSYIRRDLMQVVKYAAAKVECKTVDWGYGNLAQIGLGDMSLADGTAPGYFPGHNTHEDGNHIDVAFYQLYAMDNLLRPVCRHYDGVYDTYNCTDLPYALDALRTALFIAYLAEHPHVRYILVDELVGLALEEAYEELESLGWLELGSREKIPLVYPADRNFHHDHMHIAMNSLHPIVAQFELKPDTLNKKNRGKYITGYIELNDGYDVNDVEPALALFVNGHTILYSEPEATMVSDYNNNGVPDLTVKFVWKPVEDAIGTGIVEFAITGVADDTFFQASDTINVISP